MDRMVIVLIIVILAIALLMANYRGIINDATLTRIVNVTTVLGLVLALLILFVETNDHETDGGLLIAQPALETTIPTSLSQITVVVPTILTPTTTHSLNDGPTVQPMTNTSPPVIDNTPLPPSRTPDYPARFRAMAQTALVETQTAQIQAMQATGTAKVLQHRFRAMAQTALVEMQTAQIQAMQATGTAKVLQLEQTPISAAISNAIVSASITRVRTAPDPYCPSFREYKKGTELQVVARTTVSNEIWFLVPATPDNNEGWVPITDLTLTVPLSWIEDRPAHLSHFQISMCRFG